ncbi:MAG TPA: hypothetical protein VK054_10840, partial [Beutenbergiaceae bacterium]|nr:hypothetical protein [Beutenbergiaceae bacterium]
MVTSRIGIGGILPKECAPLTGGQDSFLLCPLLAATEATGRIRAGSVTMGYREPPVLTGVVNFLVPNFLK